jgi:putative DNA primase/helicase
MVDENIVRLAALQDTAELPANAEDAIALAFADQYADALRYVALWSRWLDFTGTRWVDDSTLHTFDRVRAICREIAVDSNVPLISVATAKTVAAVERLAKADRRLAATTEQWDADHWTLNTGDSEREETK